MKNWILLLTTIFFLGSLLTGCGGSETKTGTLSISITDAPVDDAIEVVVKFDAIEIKPQQGPSFTIPFDESKSIDLLALQNGETASLLQNESLDAGVYNWIRLMVSANEGETDSYIVLDESGAQFPLYIPSGDNTGLKLNRPFTITAGGMVHFTIDFDLRKSVHNPENGSDDYILRPTLRIVDDTEVGTIFGFVSAGIVNSNESCTEGLAIYLYSGAGVTPDDEGSDTSPLTSATPVYNSLTDNYEYQIGFVLAGDYTVALTCDAENDDPLVDETDDNVWSILDSTEASVTVNEPTEVNFE